MNKSIIFLLSILGITLFNTKNTAMQANFKPNIEFEYKELTRRSIYVTQDGQKEFIGSISITKGQSLSIFASPAFSAIDKKLFPPSMISLITVVSAINARKKDLEKTILLGDLYIFPKYRGKEFAQILVKNTCQELFEKEGINFIVLIPDPFEYENNMQKSFHGTPDYDIKKEQLIRLYKKCSFNVDEADGTIFMYLAENKNS